MSESKGLHASPSEWPRALFYVALLFSIYQIVTAAFHPVTSQVLRAGHVGFLLLLVGLKSVASAISIGSGFRGGLFFASLFRGALLGKAFADEVALLKYMKGHKTDTALAIFNSPHSIRFPDYVQRAIT